MEAIILNIKHLSDDLRDMRETNPDEYQLYWGEALEELQFICDSLENPHEE